MTFFEELKQQRWDDHRFYHRSRINQALHLLSAISFLATYILISVNPVVATVLGWFVAMWLRQVGHFFFEPKEYDEVNRASHEEKEAMKIGYNLKRKVILLVIWAAIPFALHFNPAFFGAVTPHAHWGEYVHNLAILWLGLGVAGLLFRTIQLFFIKSVQTGLVWFIKILTEPFHDIKIYWRSPLYIMKGELIDPMHDVVVDEDEADLEEPNFA